MLKPFALKRNLWLEPFLLVSFCSQFLLVAVSVETMQLELSIAITMQVTTSVALIQILRFYCKYAGGTFCYSYVGGSFCCNHADDCFCCSYAVRSFCSKYEGNNFYCNYAGGSLCCNCADGIFCSVLCTRLFLLWSYRQVFLWQLCRWHVQVITLYSFF